MIDPFQKFRNTCLYRSRFIAQMGSSPGLQIKIQIKKLTFWSVICYDDFYQLKPNPVKEARFFYPKKMNKNSRVATDPNVRISHSEMTEQQGLAIHFFKKSFRKVCS